MMTTARQALMATTHFQNEGLRHLARSIEAKRSGESSAEKIALSLLARAKRQINLIRRWQNEN